MSASISSHELNKREAFDGMRAYHQSEIEHKKDAIEIIKTILTTNILIFTGLLTAIYTDFVQEQYIVYLAYLVFIVMSGAVVSIVHTTCKKINEDNSRYEFYKQEYIKSKTLLGITNDLDIFQMEDSAPEAPQVLNKPTTKGGFYFTKRIIIGFSAVTLFISLVGTIAIYVAVNFPTKTIKEREKPSIHQLRSAN